MKPGKRFSGVISYEGVEKCAGSDPVAIYAPFFMALLKA
jgi:hypothetical protein